MNLPQNKAIQEWGYEPICAQCYLGGTGIAACFEGGADIVLCGRVADASVTVGAAMVSVLLGLLCNTYQRYLLTISNDCSGGMAGKIP